MGQAHFPLRTNEPAPIFCPALFLAYSAGRDSLQFLEYRFGHAIKSADDSGDAITYICVGSAK